MKQKVICGIYLLRNEIDGKVYVGQSHDILERKKQHLKSKDDALLHKAIRKYGTENFSFEILEECDAKELNEKEALYIQLYNSYVGKGKKEGAKGYNLTLGGDGTRTVLVDEQLICSYYNSGLPQNEVAEKIGISVSIVERVLNKNNIAIRSNKEQRLAKKAWNRQYIWKDFESGVAIIDLASKFKLKHKKVVKYLISLRPENLSLDDFVYMLKNSGATPEELKLCFWWKIVF